MFGLGRKSVLRVIQQQNAEELTGLHASPERNGFVLYIRKGGAARTAAHTRRQKSTYALAHASHEMS